MRPGQGLEPSKYVLKNQFWNEYDPSYPNISQKLHNEIMDNLPQVTKKQPMVNYDTKPSIHPVFASVYVIVSTDPCLLHILRDIMLTNARKRGLYSSLGTSDIDADEVIRRATKSLKSSGLLFTNALQLLTIVATCCEEIRQHPCDTLKDINYLRRFERVLVFLMEEQSLQIDEMPAIRIPSMMTVLEDLVESMMGSSLSASKPSQSTGSFDPDQSFKCWLEWIVDTLSDSSKSLVKTHETALRLEIAASNDLMTLQTRIDQLQNEISSYIQTRRSNNIQASLAKEKLQKQQKAREKAMKKLKRSAQNFMTSSGLGDEPGEMDSIWICHDVIDTSCIRSI